MRLLQKYIFVLILFFAVLSVFSCEKEAESCEFETVCFGQGNCIEKPIEGKCL